MFSKVMYSHWQLSPYRGNSEDFPAERTSEKSVFIATHCTSFYRGQVLNLQAGVLYAGWFHGRCSSVPVHRAASKRRGCMAACWHSCAAQSGGWQQNKRALLLIESSQNSHSNREKPNHKTDTRCPLFFSHFAWTASDVELSHLLQWLCFRTVEIHSCSS